MKNRVNLQQNLIDEVLSNNDKYFIIYIKITSFIILFLVLLNLLSLIDFNH